MEDENTLDSRFRGNKGWAILVTNCVAAPPKEWMKMTAFQRFAGVESMITLT